ncbi:surface lipoprotein assembly modifier [Glaesserella parasuis]|uniref:surface lipoprotein assembly modifier n=1 Tax=Glaesserella parasuis TaxID=738 RepID=UPI000415F774|nr:surface lipoprotein assembly modifier [Glaesserella parasuis]MDD2157958.1 surface lipoprotein assembly modifier [Glaesserella parasuis]MDD2175042.1 surface lipoprotein assembly modifier [Glaesserella parasuis]MDE3995920.1 surface lipoprotein assembly modifier [Glaesserella parasuis]MDE4013078.1 surface lipoprotein assembly modifier [Glaesserella parasuis]MDE4016896.1 surface lipoprotein assembly modifier [Glaesserella parasuis]
MCLSVKTAAMAILVSLGVTACGSGGGSSAPMNNSDQSNQVRKDREVGLDVTLWHRNLHFWGITPKISYQYQRVNSNLVDLYSYKRNRVYLSFEKSF